MKNMIKSIILNIEGSKREKEELRKRKEKLRRKKEFNKKYNFIINEDKTNFYNIIVE